MNDQQQSRADALTSMFAAHPELQDDRAVFLASQVRAMLRNVLADSANETGAEGATWYDRWQAECMRDHGEYDENAPIADRLRWWVPKSARHGTILLEDDLREAADELSRSPAMAAAAPADKHGTIECQAHSGPDRTECGGTGAWSGSADERAMSFEAWCDRFPEISAVERLRDAWQEARAAASPAAEAKPVGHVRGYISHGGGKQAGIEFTGESLPYGTPLYAASQPAQADASAEARLTSFHFHRFVDGQKMAEDILIERERTLDAAIQAVARSCPKRPLTVLVHAPALASAPANTTEAREPMANYVVPPVTLFEQQKRTIAERHFKGAPDVCRALQCIDDACAEMLASAPADAGESVAIVRRQPNGAIAMFAPNGKPFDMSAFVGATFYTAPPVARVASLTDEQRESIEHAATWLGRSEDLQNKAHAKRLCDLLNGMDHDR
ncbi:hypothetical protein [Burkholderia pseudomallei]|uniref:hypothetical protein n=1 Tax=Burkholderia pseudomallei TaxID=28450 RepID=UPI00053819F9|nr:hypothetical protein [Burkholderia pseudomallei]KGW43966.1 putative gp43 [Burkholderia pseudomallei MSHR1000]